MARSLAGDVICNTGTMKIVVAFLIGLIAVAYAQLGLVQREVHALISADPSITVGECTKMCDDAFLLQDPVEETKNDHECAYQCHCQITNPKCNDDGTNKSSGLGTSALTLLLPALVLASLQFVDL